MIHLPRPIVSVCIAALFVVTASAVDNTSPAMQLIKLNKKFNGANSCKGNDCHNKGDIDAPPSERGHEWNIWDGKDLHRHAFDVLTDKETAEVSKKIGAALKIEKVTESDRCLSCHALSVPKELRGEKFSLKEGNSCESCHGPSEKWLGPHQKKGWNDTQRKAMNHEGMLTQFGLFDTRPLTTRAAMCTSCHLSIDADMVAAGHPQPMFEMDYYSAIEPKHWIEDEKFTDAKIWLSGQLVSTRESMMQLATRVTAKADAAAMKAAKQQALAHASVFTPAAKAVGVDKVDAAFDALKKAGDDAAALGKAAADFDAALKGADAKIEAANPDAKTSLAWANLIAGMDLKKDADAFGMAQQSMAVASLYASYAAEAKVADDARKGVEDLINAITPDPDKKMAIDAATYDAGLAAVKGKLPK